MNDKEYMDALTGALSRSIEQAQPLARLTPERIEVLARQAEERYEARRRRRMLVLTQWSMAASVALLIGVGSIKLWNGTAEMSMQEYAMQTADIAPNGGSYNSPGCPNPGTGSRPKGAADSRARKPWVNQAQQYQRPEGAQHYCREGVAPLQGASDNHADDPGFNRLDRSCDLQSRPLSGAQSPWAMDLPPVGGTELYAEAFPSAVIDLTPSAVMELDEEAYEWLLAECRVQPEVPQEEPLYAWGEQLKQSMVDFGRELLCTKFHICPNTEYNTEY